MHRGILDEEVNDMLNDNVSRIDSVFLLSAIFIFSYSATPPPLLIVYQYRLPLEQAAVFSKVQFISWRSCLGGEG